MTTDAATQRTKPVVAKSICVVSDVGRLKGICNYFDSGCINLFGTV